VYINNMHRHLTTTIRRACAHEYDPHTDYRLCAVIVRGGRILSTGFNRRSTNAFVEHYTDLVRGTGRGFSLSTHAEMDAVLSARDKIDLRGCKIFVARLRADGSIGLARPCEICFRVLQAYSINKAYYTINNHEYGVMKITQNGEYVPFTEGP
jgi:deoxycytidylate deaminase